MGFFFVFNLYSRTLLVYPFKNLDLVMVFYKENHRTGNADLLKFPYKIHNGMCTE